MPIKLKIGLICVSIFIFFITVLILKKDRMPVKYSLVWFFSSFIILMLAIFPSIFEKITSLVGFVTISNMIIGVFIFILLMICISLTVIVSTQKRRITLLIQEISILKDKIND